MKGAVAVGLVLVLLAPVPGLAGSTDQGPGTATDGYVPGEGGGGRPSSGLARTALPAAGAFRAVAAGDIDLDGLPDLVAAGEGGLDCWSGDGAGSWTARPVPSGSGSYRAVAIGDLDHDGQPDIVAAGDSGVACWAGDGAWGWTPRTAPVGSGPVLSLALGDLDIDGNPDIAAGGPAGIAVRLGDGKGGWTPASAPVADGTWHGLAVGDLDTDGKPDIAAGGSDPSGNGTFRVFLGGGAGAWPARVEVAAGLPGAVRAVAIADLDRDGRPDLVAAGDFGIGCWYGSGQRAWSAGAAPVAGNGLGALAVSDLDLDGKADIAAGGPRGALVWLGDGRRGWPAVPAAPLFNLTVTGLAVAPVDSNAMPDLVASTTGSGLGLWLSDVPAAALTGWGAASSGLPSTDMWADIDLGDVDRDGRTDLVVTSFQDQDKGIRVFLGDGAGSWRASSSGLPVTGSFGGARFADLDHDGNLDLVATTDAGLLGSAGTRVWRGDGRGAWSPAGVVDARSGSGLEIGDLDNDGHIDIVTGYWAGDWGPMVFLGNGNLTFRADSGPASATNVDDVAVCDANRDGRPDFAASTMDTRGVQFWIGDGTGAAGSWKREDSGLPSTAVFLGVTAGDVNGDGRPDLAAAGYGLGNGLHVYLGDGGDGGTLDWTESSAGLPSLAKFSGVELGDIDLDGNADLLAGNVSNGGLDLFLGNGGAGGSMRWTEAGRAPLPSGGNVWGVKLGDIDNDGVLDIAATPESGGVSVWRTETARPARIDRVEVTPPAGSVEAGQPMEFSARAYLPGGEPAEGVTYLWELEGAVGSLDARTGPTVNFTGSGEGTGRLRVTAVQGLFALGAAADLDVKPAPDVTVLAELSVSPASIWVRGTGVPGYRENATVSLGLMASGRDVNQGDGLSLVFALAPGISAAEGSLRPPPDSREAGPGGATLLNWAVPSLTVSAGLTIALEVASDNPGEAVPVNVAALSEVRYANRSGPQAVLLPQLLIQVRSVLVEPPGPPAGLQVRAGDGWARLSWGPPLSDGNSTITGYRVYRGSAAGAGGLLTQTEATSYNDTSVTNGVKYFYSVSARNAAGEGPRTPEAAATPNGQEERAPSEPQGLDVTEGDGRVDLRWSAPADDGGAPVTGYRVFRGAVPGQGALIQVLGPVLEYSDLRLTNGKVYYYSVAALNRKGAGPATPEERAQPWALATSPQNLRALHAGGGRVRCSWDPPVSDGGFAVGSYKVYRAEGAGSDLTYAVVGQVAENGFTDAVQPGKTYSYKVSALTEKGEGPASEAVQVRIPSEGKPSGPGSILWLLPIIIIAIAAVVFLAARKMKGRGTGPNLN